MGITKKTILIFSFAIFLLAISITPVHAAKLFLSPSSGTFSVGSTFDVSVILDTKGKSINTISATIYFPSDKLQLVSPTTGKSIIGIWTAQPEFDNANGIINLQGGIPNGINVSRGLISTVTFRVKRVGSAVVKFSDDSNVLLNDGKGTFALEDTQNGVYELVLPPPAGPVVASETHPDQRYWYSDTNIILRWEQISGVEGYSYILSDEPTDLPDNVSDGIKNNIVYKDLRNGTHYFHIKSLRDRVWGGVTHFAINIDSAPPALFNIEIYPGARTSSKRQVVNFNTTDEFSGIDRYEYKVISLQPVEEKENDLNGPQNFFIETQNPQTLNLDLGTYDIIVRAYDKAGNFQEVTWRLKVVNPLFQIISSQGIKIGGLVTLSWFWSSIIIGFTLTLLWYCALRIYKWHKVFEFKKTAQQLPSQVKKQLDELQQYRKRYGKVLIFLILIGSLFSVQPTKAQQIELSPPFVSSFSRNISNEEIFYMGGKTDSSGVEVIIYLQNLQTGETFSDNIISDSKGNWFYRHPTFLTSGDYLLWTQSKIGENLSPPSPQIKMTVQKTAIQFGASRFSYEFLYLIASAVFLLIVIGLIIFIGYHFYHGRKKHAQFLREVKEAQESVRRGFAVLRRDIQAEFALVKKMKAKKVLSEEEKLKEEQLLKDIQNVEQYIGKEIWDIEESESFG